MTTLDVNDLDLAVAELQSAEDFLGFFEVTFDADFIRSRRIHLMRLFHANLHSQSKTVEEETGYPEDDETTTSKLSWQHYQDALSKAYCLLKHGVRPEFAASKCGSCCSCDD